MAAKSIEERVDDLEHVMHEVAELRSEQVVLTDAVGVMRGAVAGLAEQLAHLGDSADDFEEWRAQALTMLSACSEVIGGFARPRSSRTGE